MKKTSERDSCRQDSGSRDSQCPIQPAPRLLPTKEGGVADQRPARPPAAGGEGMRVVVIGLGDGGCNVAAHMARQRQEGPRLVVVNTEPSIPIKSPGLSYVQIGKGVMKDMGTGGDPRVGRRAAESDIDAVRNLFKDVDLVFLVVGLGGGTGTGAAPLVIEEARNAGALTLCFAMLPFEFEGMRRMEHAKRGLAALHEVSDGVICMPNQRLFKTLERRANISKAFKKADEMLSQGIYAVWREMCRGEGVSGIHLTFADLRMLIRNGSGQCVFGCAEGAGPDKVDAVLKEIQNNPLLNEGQAMANAYSFLVSITGGPDLSLEEVNRIMAGILPLTREQALIKTGVRCDPGWKDRVFVTILVSEKEQAQDSGRHVPGQDREDEVAASEQGGADGGPATGHGKVRTRKLKQGSLFESGKLGRFKGIDPTIVEGNNLDIPTFIRRGILIQKPRTNAF